MYFFPSPELFLKFQTRDQSVRGDRTLSPQTPVIKDSIGGTGPASHAGSR